MKLSNLFEAPISDKQKDVKKTIRDYFRGTKIRIKSAPGKGEWIEVRLVNWQEEKLSADLRNAALDVIYGKAFSRNREDPNAGNVRANMIAMTADQWDKTFVELL